MWWINWRERNNRFFFPPQCVCNSSHSSSAINTISLSFIDDNQCSTLTIGRYVKDKEEGWYLLVCLCGFFIIQEFIHFYISDPLCRG